jgi:hypothetical protein
MRSSWEQTIHTTVSDVGVDNFVQDSCVDRQFCGTISAETAGLIKHAIPLESTYVEWYPFINAKKQIF